MDQGPVVSAEIEAGARFLAEFQKYAPVQAAFWLKPSDEYGSYLYVASGQINDENLDVAYGEVARLWQQMQDPWFDPFRVKLIGADDRLAKAAAEARRRYPGRRPIHLRGTTFGGVSADEVYIYPPAPVPVK
jgi:hypothetical protein